MTAYIRKETSRRTKPSLLMWNVAVMGGPITDPAHEFTFCDEVRVGTVVRSKLKETGGSKADIKTLMSKEHIVIDMDIAPSKARSRSESDLKAMRDAPDYADRGLLLLYPIARDSEPDPANLDTREPLDAPGHVVGMALVFPGSGDVVANKYVQVDTSGVDDSEYDEVDAAINGDDSGVETA